MRNEKEREQMKQEKEIAMKKRAEEQEKKAAAWRNWQRRREMRSRKRVATTSAAVSRKKKKAMHVIRINLQHQELLPLVVRLQVKRSTLTSVVYASKPTLKMSLKALAWTV